MLDLLMWHSWSTQGSQCLVRETDKQVIAMQCAKCCNRGVHSLQQAFYILVAVK